MIDITHSYLVNAGAAWLKKKVELVFCELVVGSVSEQPDVIGWSVRGTCTVIECKASRSDYLSNKNKCFERGGYSVGSYRYFLVPKGIIKLEDLYPGYGLLELRLSKHPRGHYIKILKQAPHRKPWDGISRSALQERKMLITIARREHMFEVGGKGWHDWQMADKARIKFLEEKIERLERYTECAKY